MSNSKELESLVNEYSGMGFDAQDIIMAWFNSNRRKTLILDHLLNIAYSIPSWWMTYNDLEKKKAELKVFQPLKSQLM